MKLLDKAEKLWEDTEKYGYYQEALDDAVNKEDNQMEFIICYTDNKGNNVWEEIIGEDAMQLRIGELADEELHCCTDAIMVFERTTQW